MRDLLARRPTRLVERRIYGANLVVQIGIVVTGGLVHLTESGLGCPTWPDCVPGSVFPVPDQAQGWHKLIEFGNRLLTYVVVAAVVLALWAAWRRRPRRQALVGLAAVQVLGVFAQAILGGITVLTRLNPAAVAGHFLLSMVLVAFAAYLYQRSGQGDGPPRRVVRRELVAMGFGLSALGALILMVGTVVTGSTPQRANGMILTRFPFSPREVAWLHADLAVLLTGLSIGLALAVRVSDAPRPARRVADLMVGVIIVQAAIGYFQYFTHLPVAAVDLHMLGASLLVTVLVRVVTTLRVRDPEPAWDGVDPQGPAVVGRRPAPDDTLPHPGSAPAGGRSAAGTR